MLLSRFWYVVLAAFAGLAFVGTSIVQSTYEHDRGRDAETLLRGDRQQVDNFLRTDARLRLNNLLEIASQADLGRAMDQARTRANDTTALTQAAVGVSTQLRAINNRLPAAAQGQMLIAVDLRGYVVGRVGLNENSGIGDYLGGSPLVSRALDGYVRDDMWELQGRVFRMAARPVIYQGRYVGAVLHAQEINDAFVQRVSELLGGASVVFFANGQSFSSRQGESERGRAAPTVAALSEQLRSLATNPQWTARGYTDVLALSSGDGAAVYSTMAGTLGLTGGGFAIGRPRPVLPPDYLLHAPSDEVRRVKWPLVISSMLGAILLGIAFVYLEHDAPNRKLRRALEQLAEGKIDRLDPLSLRGNARAMALSINEAFERALREEVTRSGGRARKPVEDLESLLGPAPSAPSEPAAMPFGDLPPLTTRSVGVQSASALDLPPPPPLNAGPPANRPAPPPPPAAKPPAPPAPSAPAAAAAPAAATAEAEPSLAIFANEAEEQSHWRDVFDQFVALKKELGEPTEALTFEKFSGTLQKHKDQVLQRSKCRAVRFSVYTKEGKATLKATPVK